MYTIKKIKQGEKFSKKNSRSLRPFIGLPASDSGKVLNKKSKKNREEYHQITKNDF